MFTWSPDGVRYKDMEKSKGKLEHSTHVDPTPTSPPPSPPSPPLYHRQLPNPLPYTNLILIRIPRIHRWLFIYYILRLMTSLWCFVPQTLGNMPPLMWTLKTPSWMDWFALVCTRVSFQICSSSRWMSCHWCIDTAVYNIAIRLLGLVLHLYLVPRGTRCCFAGFNLRTSSFEDRETNVGHGPEWTLVIIFSKLYNI